MVPSNVNVSKSGGWEDPRDLFYGLNDLALRVRTLRKEETEAHWPEIQGYIDNLIDLLDSFRRPALTQEAVTGSSYQCVLLALEAMRIARRSAAEHSLRSTADAVQQASLIMRSGTAAFALSAGA